MLRMLGCLALLFIAPCAMIRSSTAAAEMPAEDAWNALPTYQYGQDTAVLLTIDRAVIGAMATPASRSACAARLAALLEVPDTTLAAKQYICLQLRQVGTPAETPVLTRLLADPKTSEMARYALESIPGEQSLAALRDALGTLDGGLLIGAINSVAVRKDVRSVAKLKELAGREDRKLAFAALRALGNIASPEAVAFVRERAQQAGAPMPELAVVLLQCADALSVAGDIESSRAIYVALSADGQPAGIRRSAFEGILRLQKEQAITTILSWIADADADRRLVATARLATLPDEQFNRLLAGLSEANRLRLTEVLALRGGKNVLSLATSAARSDQPCVRLAGIRALGQIGDASAIPVLLDSLAAGGNETEAARAALCQLPRKATCDALLLALTERPGSRGPVIEILATLKCYDAIDPLIAIAGTQNPNAYEPALKALRGIADPDDRDVPRLVKLLLAASPGKHREEVERTIVVVCGKLPEGLDRAKPVLAALAKASPEDLPKYLPLLGRLGGSETLEKINISLKSENPEVREAAVRALCNWPNAEVADRLWDFANGENKEFRSQALRAYVRVVTLKSGRPPAQTLAMLQKAMKLAQTAQDRQWVLIRASTVRTRETVAWIAEYLDDPNLNQAACQAIVELAHHRFLRHPNMDQFGPLLEKVSRISRNPSVVERAKKYRLGL